MHTSSCAFGLEGAIYGRLVFIEAPEGKPVQGAVFGLFRLNVNGNQRVIINDKTYEAILYVEEASEAELVSMALDERSAPTFDVSLEEPLVFGGRESDIKVVEKRGSIVRHTGGRPGASLCVSYIEAGQELIPIMTVTRLPAELQVKDPGGSYISTQRHVNERKEPGTISRLNYPTEKRRANNLHADQEELGPLEGPTFVVPLSRKHAGERVAAMTTCLVHKVRGEILSETASMLCTRVLGPEPGQTKERMIEDVTNMKACVCRPSGCGHMYRNREAICEPYRNQTRTVKNLETREPVKQVQLTLRHDTAMLTEGPALAPRYFCDDDAYVAKLSAIRARGCVPTTVVLGGSDEVELHVSMTGVSVYANLSTSPEALDAMVVCFLLTGCQNQFKSKALPRITHTSTSQPNVNLFCPSREGEWLHSHGEIRDCTYAPPACLYTDIPEYFTLFKPTAVT